MLNLVDFSHFSLFLSICLSISRWDIVAIFLIISSYHLSFFLFWGYFKKERKLLKTTSLSLLIVFIKKVFNWVAQESRPSVKPVMQKKKGTLTTNRREGGTVQRQGLLVNTKLLKRIKKLIFTITLSFIVSQAEEWFKIFSLSGLAHIKKLSLLISILILVVLSQEPGS